MATFTEVISSFPPDLQGPVLQLWNVIKDELGVKREDFTELKSIVQELAQAQRRTEERMEELAQAQGRTEERMEELAQAQRRTEERMEELAQAQRRTEERVEELAQAQRRTEERVEELVQVQSELAQAQRRTEERMEELAQAQRQTEERVEELAQAQRQTDRSVQRLSETIEFKIGGLGRRWGVGSEESFRRGLREILSDTGYEVVAYIKKDDAGVVFGHPAVIEIDVLVRGDRTVGVEIKSSVGRDDVYVFKRKAEFYERMSGHRIDLLLMITPFIDDEARRVATEFGMVVCDSLSMLEGDGLKGL